MLKIQLDITNVYACIKLETTNYMCHNFRRSLISATSVFSVTSTLTTTMSTARMKQTDFRQALYKMYT